MKLRINQYRAAERSGKLNPDYKVALENLGIKLDTVARKIELNSSGVKASLAKFLELFIKHMKEHGHGYFEVTTEIDGLNMREWSERIRKMVNSNNGSLTDECLSSLFKSGFLMTHKECFIEKMLVGLELYLKVNGKLPGRRQRNEFDEPVGSWLRTIKKRMNDSTMPESMKPRAISLIG